MATLPTRLVEIEFDTGVWTDVAADVVGLSTSRGRNRESGAFEAGTITVTLRNDTRKYDPDHTAGTYYGKLRPNRRIRFRATYSAVTYDIFVGFIDRITQNYGGPNDATATIEATDFFKLLRIAQLPASVYAAEVDLDNPVHWWRFGEPTGSTVAVDAVEPPTNGTYTGGVTFGVAGGPVRDDDTAITLDGSTGFFEAAVTLPAYPYSIELWLKLPERLTTGNMIFFSNGRNGLNISPVGYVSGTDLGAPGILTFGGLSTATRVDDNVWHHVMFSQTGTGASQSTLVVDGTPTYLGTTGAVLNVGGTIQAGYDSAAPFAAISSKKWAGSLDELAIYNTDISFRADNHSDAGDAPWNGDTPGDRIDRLFDFVPTFADLDLDLGTTTLQATDLGGDVLSYAQKVEETEAGRFFVSANGTVTFIGRRDAETGAYLTSQATFVDDDSGAGIPYRSVSADVDGSTIVTRATVSREGSVALTYYDATAQAEFGQLEEVHSGLLHNSDTYSRLYAEWIVSTHKTPTSRIGTLTMDLPKDPAAMYPAILSLELAEQVLYKRKPQNTGSVISIPMRVEKIEHATGPHYWRTSLQLSPFGLGTGGWATGVWDTSLWDQATWGL